MRRDLKRSPEDLIEEVHRQVAHVSGGVAALRASLAGLELAREVAQLPRLVSVLQEIGDRLQEAARFLDPSPPQPRLFPGSIRPRLATLSPRQRRVLEDVVAGKTNKEIAYEIGVSEKTVETHRARVMAKLHARSLAHLVRISLAYETQDDGSAFHREREVPGFDIEPARREDP